MQQKTLLIGSRTNTSTSILISDWRLRTDDDLDTFPNAIETILEGWPVTIYLRPDLSFQKTPATIMLGFEALQLRNNPVLDHAIRHPRAEIVRGSTPAKNRRLEAFILYRIVGEAYEVVDGLDEYDPVWSAKFEAIRRDACSFHSYIGQSYPKTWFFAGLDDAVMFKMRWG